MQQELNFVFILCPCSLGQSPSDRLRGPQQLRRLVLQKVHVRMFVCLNYHSSRFVPYVLFCTESRPALRDLRPSGT